MIVAGFDLEHDDLAVLDRYDSTYGSLDTVYAAVDEIADGPSYQGSSGHHYDPTEVPFEAAKHGRTIYVTDGVVA